MKRLCIMIGVIFLAFIMQSCEKEENKLSMMDGDGNVYTSVIIGSQTWLKENLRTTKYNNGEDIASGAKGVVEATPQYWWYNNDEPTYGDTYGALYNWFAVNTGNLCPEGWHVPSNTEWTTLVDYVGGEYIAGNILKESGNSHWSYIGSTDELGFSALPGGCLEYDIFSGIREYGFWWTSTEESHYFAYNRFMDCSTGSVYTGFGVWEFCGCSVRCVKD